MRHDIAHLATFVDAERLAEIEFEIVCHDELQALVEDTFVRGVLTFDEAHERYLDLWRRWDREKANA